MQQNMPSMQAAPDRTRVILELVWVSLGVGLLMDWALSRGWLGAGSSLAEMNSLQLMVLLLVQNLVAVGSIMAFLRLQGKGLDYLGFRRRPLMREVALGLALFPPVLFAALLLETLLLHFLPALHNVEVNPILAMIQSPRDVAALLVASVLAGGVGEEAVRAFVLRRFETHLGGMGVGLAVWSLAFGAMHLSQGVDKALVVSLFGLVLGLLYAWRRSPIAAMVVHGAFNVANTMAAYLLLGG
jgi:membrane protease YdiL (CAAX protease family)